MVYLGEVELGVFIVVHGFVLFVRLLLFYAIATAFQLYHGNAMMYETRRSKPDPTLLRTQVIFNLPHHLMRGTGL